MVQAMVLIMAKSGRTSTVIKEVEKWPEVVQLTVVEGTCWEIVLVVEGPSLSAIKTTAHLKYKGTQYVIDVQVWGIVSSEVKHPV